MARLSVYLLALAVSGLFDTPARGQDADPLNLQLAPEQAVDKASPLRLAFEIGGGRIDLRDGGTRDARLLSLDLRYTDALSESWRWGISDRFDHVDPALLGQKRSSNSLRELFVAWQQPGETLSVDVGRINHRQGPAYGFNPTDYFRRGALRTVTTADPVALRERRLGTAMLRAGQLWQDAGVTVVLAPKLDDGPRRAAASLDWGATNNKDRAMISASLRRGQAFNGQASLLLERSESAVAGASFTALAGDSLVLFGELARGKFRPLLEQVAPTGASAKSSTQAAAGLTYTFPGALSLTLEADYNGAGLDAQQWQALLAQGPAAYQRYFAWTQASQELGARRAWLVYASQKSLGLKQLDFTAFVRGNAVDDSRLLWAELRYHWNRIDGVLQWQRSQGRAATEFGVLPYRQAVQLSLVVFL